MARNKRTTKRLRLLFLAVFVLILGLILFISRGAIKAKLNDWKLIPQPETFTELYLNDYTSLSKSLPGEITGGEKISFSFTIHNVENKEVLYPYTVYMIGEKVATSTALVTPTPTTSTFATTTIKSGSVLLGSGASTTISQSYTFKKNNPPTQATFFVTLTEKNQSLHFFVPNRN